MKEVVKLETVRGLLIHMISLERSIMRIHSEKADSYGKFASEKNVASLEKVLNFLENEAFKAINPLKDLSRYEQDLIRFKYPNKGDNYSEFDIFLESVMANEAVKIENSEEYMYRNSINEVDV